MVGYLVRVRVRDRVRVTVRVNGRVRVRVRVRFRDRAVGYRAGAELLGLLGVVSKPLAQGLRHEAPN